MLRKSKRKQKIILPVLIVSSLFFMVGCSNKKDEILMNDLNTWKTDVNKDLYNKIEKELEKETKPDFKNTKPESKIYSNIDNIIYKPNLEIGGITAYVTIGEFKRYTKEEIESTELDVEVNNKEIEKEYEKQKKNNEPLSINTHLGARYTSKLVVLDIDSKGNIDNSQEEY